MSVQQSSHIRHQRPQPFAHRQRLIEDALEIDRLGLEIALQHEVVEIQHLAQFGGEAFLVEQIAQPHRPPRRLVFIGRSNAAPGGADGPFAARLFTGLIQGNVIGQNQRTGFTNPQPRHHVHAPALQIVDFGQQRRRR